jgi:hypothetical protein
LGPSQQSLETIEKRMEVRKGLDWEESADKVQTSRERHYKYSTTKV